MHFSVFRFFLFSRMDPADIKWALGFPPLLTQTKTCVPPPTPTHTWGRTKEGGGQRKQTQKLEHTSVVGASGHKEAVWPQHFKPTIWGSLMCIDSYCTKGTKTIIGCFVCSDSSPKIPRYVQWSNLCLQSERSHRVCEIHANKTILCFSEINLVCFPWGGAHSWIYRWKARTVSAKKFNFTVYCSNCCTGFGAKTWVSLWFIAWSHQLK